MRRTSSSRLLVAAIALASLGCAEKAAGPIEPAKLPKSQNPLLVRTDFSRDSAWKDLSKAAKHIPEEVQEGIAQTMAANGHGSSGELSFVRFVDDAQYAGLSARQLLALVPQGGSGGCLLIADAATFANAERPLLVVELSATAHRTFRTIPSAVWAIVANLPIANMDWEDFANHVDSDGVYRGRELVE
jgi:hypothetical protein